MHRTFQPGRVGVNIARLVLPQAEGKAAARKRSLPFGGVTPKNLFCFRKKKPLLFSLEI